MTIIMSEKNITWPSRRNLDWSKVKSETEKVNVLLTNIPTNNITELNDICRKKLIQRKRQGSTEDHRQNFKTQMGTQIWIADKKNTTSKNTKTEHENILGRS